LQEHAEEVANGVGAMLGEALGAIAALEQKGLAGGHAGKLRFEFTRLAGEHQRREGGELLLDLVELGLIGIDRDLLDRP
jgi:hypothetical protein